MSFGKRVILVRHGRTSGNALHQSGSQESYIVGLSLKDPLDNTGEQQADRFGRDLGHYVLNDAIEIVSVHSSDATRALQTRDRVLAASGLALHVASKIRQPDPRLRELSKGSQEGQLRSVIYPTPDAEAESMAWRYRHGGSDTYLEVALKWRSWFRQAIAEDFDPAENSGEQAILVFGHNSVTANGLLLTLDHPEVDADTPEDMLPRMDESERYMIANGTALVLSSQENGLLAVTGLIPTDQNQTDLNSARGMA